MINIPIAHAIGRNIDSQAINDFYGAKINDLITGRPNRRDLKKAYCRRIGNRNRSVQETTQVQTNIGSFYYDVLFATRKTGGNNGYMEVIRHVKKFIESVHSGDVDRMLEVLDGDQGVIDSYLPDEPLDEDKFEGSNDNDNQSGLDDFF